MVCIFLSCIILTSNTIKAPKAMPDAKHSNWISHNTPLTYIAVIITWKYFLSIVEAVYVGLWLTHTTNKIDAKVKTSQNKSK